MYPYFISFLQESSTLLAITEIMLLAIAVVSLAVFVVMATFKGKSALDKLLMWRELALFAVTSRLFVLITTDFESHALVQATVYSLMALICVGVLIALIREHVFYKGAPSLTERWRTFRNK